jgi:hypothetical protein
MTALTKLGLVKGDKSDGFSRRWGQSALDDRFVTHRFYSFVIRFHARDLFDDLVCAKGVIYPNIMQSEQDIVHS